MTQTMGYSIPWTRGDGFVAQRDLALVLGGSALLALSARISFHIGPVPISAQTLVVMLLGAVLGSRRGAAAVLAYLAEGAAGLPVFASGGGAVYFFGPTGGYLVGFLPAAWLTGRLLETGSPAGFLKGCAAMLAGHAVVFAMGLAWLSVLIGLTTAISAGLVPFLPGLVVKCGLGAACLPLAQPLAKRLGLPVGRDTRL
jgi:biotin transport system substrate-specific component